MEIVQLRGSACEARHRIHAVRCRADGSVVERIGAPRITTWRSAAKPFQLEVSLGHLADVPLSDEDVAIGAASHSAQPHHTVRVQALLRRFGAAPDALRCGAHWPLHAPTARTVAAPEPVHNNCSGKHAYMVAATRRLGAPPDYLPPDHPLQRAILARVQERTAGAVEGVVTDGCGVPCFVLSLDGMATAWAALADAVTADTPQPLARIGRAMARHPEMVSGEDRLDLRLARAARRPLITKVGAMGLICAALPDSGEGVALKVESGSDDARAVAIAAVLERWFPGLLDPTPLAEHAIVRNVAGRVVGEHRAVW